MIKDSDDLGWTNLSEPFERLKWARKRRYPTTGAFGTAVGLGQNGYAAYERAPGSSKHIDLTADKAIPWAEKLRVRWQWLLDGKGVPWIDDSEQRKRSPQAERIADLVDAAPEEDQERIAAAIELLLGTGTGG